MGCLGKGHGGGIGSSAEAKISALRWTPDPAQREVLAYLSDLADAQFLSERKAWWQRWFDRDDSDLRGVYIWGPVGTGKTTCLNAFCAWLGSRRVWRVHFHAFMREVHEALRGVQGVKNPVMRVMRDVGKRVDVLCLDELLVTDISDAMLLQRVLSGAMQVGMRVVITSNTPPDRLYWGGLQRRRFLPTIAWLQSNLTVVACDHHQDYRRLSDKAMPVYFTPLGEDSDAQMRAAFARACSWGGEAKVLTVAGRFIDTLRCGEQVVWFDFEVLCSVPRSTRDYLWLAKHFETVLVSDVPILTDAHPSRVVNFIRMVDVFYDAKVALVMSAASIPDALYTEGPYAAPFARTQSRLHEMRHLPPALPK